MNEWKQKIKKLQPIINSKRIKFDEANKVLQTLRLSRMEALKKLEKDQKEYIQGVEVLNQARVTPDRNEVSYLEQSVDSAKSNWYQSLKSLREAEEKEKIVLNLVFNIQKEIKSFEKLEEKYRHNLNLKIQQIEQKEHDEIAVKQFFRQRFVEKS